MPELAAVDLFYSYSHRDEQLRMRLENHLSILRRSRLVRDWHDRRIGAGHEWAGAIDDELERAQIILLLVSPDFIASDYCWDVELQRALERHEAGAAVVIPVILRPVLWQDAPFGKLQALPRDARPITSWRNRDSAFLNVAEGIKAAVAEISARVTIPARVRRVSPPHNPAFTGRDTELERLDQLLRDHHVVAITGRGGAGKTQLAAEFCYRHADDYEIVWWIRAEEPATIGIDLAELAGALALPEATSPIRAEAVEAAQRTLARGENWLLVFDDANSWEEIRRFLPDDLKGTVLMTSRSLDGAEEVAALPVDVLTTSAARRFLIERTGQDDPAAADEVAAVAGYLPLELEQAAAYVEATSTDLAAHAATLRFEATVRAATASVLAKVELESAAAADLISLAAFLAPADIPVDLLAPQFEESVASLADSAAVDEGLAVLRRYGLADVKGRDISLHRLVQAAARERMDEDDRTAWLAQAVDILNEAFPTPANDPTTWPDCERLLPHALEVAGHGEAMQASLSGVSRLLNESGLYFKGRADLAAAKALYERALSIYAELDDPEASATATLLGNLGGVYADEGDLAAARNAYERALAICEEALGPEHPSVAVWLNNLGFVEKGDLDRARQLLERALAIDETAYGPEHPSVAIRLDNLGIVVRRKGDLALARELHERALRIDEQAHGPEHPYVAIRLNNLAAVLFDEGDLLGARAHLERALAIIEHAYDAEHPNVARMHRSLGFVVAAQGDAVEARLHLDRALTILESVYGADHPETEDVRAFLRRL